MNCIEITEMNNQSTETSTTDQISWYFVNTTEFLPGAIWDKLITWLSRVDNNIIIILFFLFVVVATTHDVDKFAVQTITNK